ncbi:hypothetical protein YPPY12_4315, partial [Yersinia pestis PY-12]
MNESSLVLYGREEGLNVT